MADKKVSSLIENDDFKDGIQIVNEYIKYLIKKDMSLDDKIADLLEKCKNNVAASQEILKDFNLVRFVEKDRQLYIEPIDNTHDIRFKVDSLINRTDERPILKMLQKRIAGYQTEIDTATLKRDEKQAEIDSLEMPKLKKKWGIFSNKEEENKLMAQYNKQHKKLTDELEKIQSNIDMIQFQIDTNQHIMNSIKEKDKFISSISRKDKKSILEHYDLIKELFNENEKYYSKIREFEKAKKFVPSLNNFVSSYLPPEKKELFDRLMESIEKEYQTVRYYTKESTNRREQLNVRYLTQRLDFGEYNGLVDVITNQIGMKESLSIPTCEVMKGEEFTKQL